MQRAEVRIERYADQGRCIAHIDGRVVFVRFALPGERVRIVLDEPHDRAGRFWTGEVTEVLEASPDRVEPPWRLAGPQTQGGGVGGADLVHVGLAGQLRWKAAVINEQMRRLGHLQVDASVDRLPGDLQLGGLHWRTRIEMVADAHGMPSMRRRGSHQRVPLSTMPLATHRVLAVADSCGLWNGGFRPGTRLRLAAPEHPDSESDYALIADGRLRAGEPTLREQVALGGGEPGQRFDYAVAADGFWQVHRQAPETLCSAVLARVRESLNGSNEVCAWDLYSGSGLFTLPLASLIAAHPRVLALEGDRTASRNAEKNARRAGLGNVTTLHGDVATTLAHVPHALAHPDVVILDPPRAGARRKACLRIADAAPKAVVYVACDPTSLARDAATLTEHGYRLCRIHGYDLYPMTHHVETVALFVRGAAGR